MADQNISDRVRNFYSCIRIGISSLDAGGQLRCLAELEADLYDQKVLLDQRPDFQTFLNARTADDFLAAYDAMSEDTKRAWQAQGAGERELESLKFHLYSHSPYREVRAAMRPLVDAFIDAHFSKERLLGRAPPPPLKSLNGAVLTHPEDHRVTEMSYYHDLLRLSLSGGKITRERPDAYHIAYEFNAAADGVRVAVPFNPVERLYEDGLLKNYDRETDESNLTDKGAAILTRMDERFGSHDPVADRCIGRRFTQG